MHMTSSEDVVLGLVGVDHVFGLLAGPLLALIQGCTLITVSDVMDIKQMVRAMDIFRVRLVFARLRTRPVLQA